MDNMTFQPELRPALPVVFGGIDYREFRATLESMDHILVNSMVEHRFLMRVIECRSKDYSKKQFQRHYKTLRQALRYSILLGVTNDSYRELSRRVTDSLLFQWFTYTHSVDGVRPASKSTIERFEKMFSPEAVEKLIHELNQAVADPFSAEKLLYRDAQIYFDQIFADTTCVKANIHFPVDWVLLRDASRTLIKAIKLIRSQGLRHRISTPDLFQREFNGLCMEMTQVRKKRDAWKVRKKVFRRMKKLIKKIANHGENYYQELEAHWRSTEWSTTQVRVILERMRNILDQLPQAIHQAHERIIGERRVLNKDKILSLYDPDIRVIVRGKAGAEVEFGNVLYLAEQMDGLIVDWKFIQEQSPSDNLLVKASIGKITQYYGAPSSYTADRGFDSPTIQVDLEKDNVFNGICPRSVIQLVEKLKDDVFCRHQKRRASTEARIGIFKNAYLGRPMRNKRFDHRKVRIEWCILTHNLWKLASMAVQQKKKVPPGNVIAA